MGASESLEIKLMNKYIDDFNEYFEHEYATASQFDNKQADFHLKNLHQKLQLLERQVARVKSLFPDNRSVNLGESHIYLNRAFCRYIRYENLEKFGGIFSSLSQLKELPAIIKDIDMALTLSPTMIKPRILKAQVYERNDMMSRAYAEIEQALEIMEHDMDEYGEEYYLNVRQLKDHLEMQLPERKRR